MVWIENDENRAWIEKKENDIYTTVPFDFEDHSFEKEKIVSFLKERAGKFVKARKIAEAVGLPIGGTQVQLRKLITELLELDGCPIVSSSLGFSWATSSNMLLFYKEDLENRKLGLQRRINAVNKVVRGFEGLE